MNPHRVEVSSEEDAEATQEAAEDEDVALDGVDEEVSTSPETDTHCLKEANSLLNKQLLLQHGQAPNLPPKARPQLCPTLASNSQAGPSLLPLRVTLELFPHHLPGGRPLRVSKAQTMEVMSTLLSLLR
jgi:hypothetical protein